MNTPKFKIGDKVIVTNTNYSFKTIFIGKTFTIKSINPNKMFWDREGMNNTNYGVKEPCGFVFFEEELKGVNEEMKKFTKKDLRNGDVGLFRNGEVGIYTDATGTFVFKNGYIKWESYNDDLTNRGLIDSYDIVAVRRPVKQWDCQFCAFESGYGNLVFERKEYEEMTVADIEKALGKKIKIVKEK